MSGTSWQRGVADMRAAGINPMLSFMQGGASTPSGATADVPANPLGEAVSSAMAGFQARNQNRLMLEQIRKASNDADSAETASKMAQAEYGFLFGDPARNMMNTRRQLQWQAEQNQRTASAYQATQQGRKNELPGFVSSTARQIAEWFSNAVTGGRRGKDLMYPRGSSEGTVAVSDWPQGGVDRPTVCEEKSLTRQSEAESCDINQIMKRYEKTGVLPRSIGKRCSRTSRLWDRFGKRWIRSRRRIGPSWSSRRRCGSPSGTTRWRSWISQRSGE